MADEMKRIDVIMGPYRNNLLDVPAAEADAAVGAHWARDPYSGTPYGEGHDALSAEERDAAMNAAWEWARAQWNPEPPDPPPPEGTMASRQGMRSEGQVAGDAAAERRARAQQQAEAERARTMQPANEGPGYKTR